MGTEFKYTDEINEKHTGRSIKNRTAFENDIENDEKHILRYLHDMCTCIPTS